MKDREFELLSEIHRWKMEPNRTPIKPVPPCADCGWPMGAVICRTCNNRVTCWVCDAKNHLHFEEP